MPPAIYVYAEHCVLSAQPVPASEVESKGFSDDWILVHVTEESARWWASRGRFGRRVAITIRERLGYTYYA